MGGGKSKEKSPPQPQLVSSTPALPVVSTQVQPSKRHEVVDIIPEYLIELPDAAPASKKEQKPANTSSISMQYGGPVCPKKHALQKLFSPPKNRPTDDDDTGWFTCEICDCAEEWKKGCWHCSICDYSRCQKCRSLTEKNGGPKTATAQALAEPPKKSNVVEITADRIPELRDSEPKKAEKIGGLFPSIGQSAASQPDSKKHLVEITADDIPELPDAEPAPAKDIKSTSSKVSALPNIFPTSAVPPSEADISMDTLHDLLNAPVAPREKKPMQPAADVVSAVSANPEEKKEEKKALWAPLPDIRKKKPANLELSEEEKKKMEAQREKLAALEAQMKADENGCSSCLTPVLLLVHHSVLVCVCSCGGKNEEHATEN
jgi:hypothetical protein